MAFPIYLMKTVPSVIYSSTEPPANIDPARIGQRIPQRYLKGINTKDHNITHGTQYTSRLQWGSDRHIFVCRLRMASSGLSSQLKRNSLTKSG